MMSINKKDKKSIRAYAISVLKAQFPEFNRLPRKQKKRLAEGVAEAIKRLCEMGSGFEGVPTLTAMEQLGLEKMPPGVVTLNEIKEMLEESRRTLFDIALRRNRGKITDPLLKVVDELLNDHVLNRLLAPKGYTPSKRTWQPSNYLRIELLRTMKFRHMSVREFCATVLENPNKYAEEAAFCRVRKGMAADHSSLSAFRTSMTLEMRTNLMVYGMHLLLCSGRIKNSGVFTIDSTDIASPINPRPLAKIALSDDDYIRFYADLDADCGSRRSKRDKSAMVVGYRSHTLCAVDVETKIAFPMLSLVVAANHHDSQVLEPLVAFARAVGLEIKVLAGDDAYADLEKQNDFAAQDGIRLLTPDKEDTPVPADVDPLTGEVRMSRNCPSAMRWEGYCPEERAHIFVCGDTDGDCFMRHNCSKERPIPLDRGLFRAIPSCIEAAEKIMELRKVAERPFNLLKHCDGLEPCRMKTMSTISAQACFSQLVGIFKVIAGQRSTKTADDKPKQEVLKFECG